VNRRVVATTMSVVWQRQWRQCGGATTTRLVATKRKNVDIEEEERQNRKEGVVVAVEEEKCGGSKNAKVEATVVEFTEGGKGKE